LPPFCFFKNQFRQLFYFLARERDYYHLSGVKKEIFKKVIRHNQRKFLKKIGMAVLLIWGENDFSTPLENARFLNRKIKNTKLVIVKGANHQLPYQKPERFAKEMALFLKT